MYRAVGGVGAGQERWADGSLGQLPRVGAVLMPDRPPNLQSRLTQLLSRLVLPRSQRGAGKAHRHDVGEERPVAACSPFHSLPLVDLQQAPLRHAA